LVARDGIEPPILSNISSGERHQGHFGIQAIKLLQ